MSCEALSVSVASLVMAPVTMLELTAMFPESVPAPAVEIVTFVPALNLDWIVVFRMVDALALPLHVSVEPLVVNDPLTVAVEMVTLYGSNSHWPGLPWGAEASPPELSASSWCPEVSIRPPSPD